MKRYCIDICKPHSRFSKVEVLSLLYIVYLFYIAPEMSISFILYFILYCSGCYEGCSNMNAISFITLFTYMLRHNVIPFWKEQFVAFKLAPNIKKHSIYSLSYIHLFDGHSYILTFFSEANCNTGSGTCTDKVLYLCEFETNWHPILDASCINIFKLIAGKS